MKKTLFLLVLAILFTSCNKTFDEAMKSADKALILQTANDYFAQKKWQQAITLYERLPNLVAGTDDAKTVIFNTAYANYYDKQYKVAGHHFKNFSVTFPDDPRAEEAAYMSALCYYEGSMDYNLDQSSSELAVNELQNFLNNYPESERSKNISELIDELSNKMEFKSFENAKQYYKMSEYKASNIAFENVLEDFPATKMRPQIYDYIQKSRYELAMNSVYDLKSERLENAIAYTKFVEKELPSTDYSKTAADLREKLLAEQTRFDKVKVQVEAERARIQAKQDEELAKLSAADRKKSEENDVKESDNKEADAKRDSAEALTPPPAATFRIQR